MNAKIRSVIFWIHLTVGVTAGIVVLIMSVTGVLLTYEKQMVAWADSGHRATPPAPGAPRLPAETLIAKVREARPKAPLTTMAYKPGPTEPVMFGAGRDVLYVDPYSGAVLGGASPGIRTFFASVTSWHRWLAVQGEGRATARAITGAANLGFLFLVLSGLYLWLPRKWTMPAVKAVTLFNGRASGKARDFNWHHVFGFWLGIPLAFVVATAAVISYPWASNLLYRIVGEEPPARAAGPAGGGPGAGPASANAAGAPREGGPREGGARAGGPREGGAREGGSREGAPREGAPREGGAREGAPREGGAREGGERHAAAPLTFDGLETLVARASAKVDGWRTISLRVPASADAPVVFTIDRGYAGQPQLRGTLTLDARTGQEVRWETFDSLSAGRQLRSWARFVHTGEYYGLFGQTIAGIASFAGVLLVYTGLALSCRRLAAYIRRRSRPAQGAADASATRAA